MEIFPLEVADAWVVRPPVHADARGRLHEWLRQDALQAATGRRIAVEQANCSVSARGVVRGVHFTDVPPGQAKYVSCLAGTVLDVVVDLRVGSPTYGRHAAVQLDAERPTSLLISEGIGHAFCALSEVAVVSYLCSTAYDPTRDRAIDPLDPVLGLPWPDGLQPMLSPKDAAAPTLLEAADLGILPSYAACRELLQG